MTRLLLGIALVQLTCCAAAAAEIVSRQTTTVTTSSYWGPYSYGRSARGSGPPPYAAYYSADVVITRSGQECLSKLVQFPNGWWRRVYNCHWRS
jgi:hypothetical protein